MPRDAANHPRAVSGTWRRLEALARRPTLRQVALLQVGAAAIAAIGFVSSAAMARLLGSSEFGLYALALSALSLSGIVVDLGQATGAVTLWAEAVAQGSLSRAATLGAYLLRVTLISGGLLLLAGVLAAPWLAATVYQEPRLAPLLVLLLASRVWGVGLRLPLVALQATRRMGLLVALEVGDLALRATLSVLAALAGWGAPGVVAGQALGGLLIALVALAVYARVTDREPRLPPLGEVARLALRGRLPTGQLLGFGLSVVLERDLRIVANSLPALLLGYFASAAEVGRFRVALSYMSLPTLLHEPLGRVLMVSFPELRVRDARRLGAAYWLSTLVSAAAILAVSLALALLAPWLVPLVYGREYAASAGLAALLGLAAALGGLSSTNIPLLRALNRVLPAVWLGGAALLLSLPLLAWLVAHYQALGAAAAYSLGALLLSLAGQWVAWRSLGRGDELRAPSSELREDAEAGE